MNALLVATDQKDAPRVRALIEGAANPDAVIDSIYQQGGTKQHSFSTFRMDDAAAGEQMEYAWEQLHYGDWQDVDPKWRQLYGRSALVVARARLAEGRAAEALRTCDLILMLGGPGFATAIADTVAECERALSCSDVSIGAPAADSSASHVAAAAAPPVAATSPPPNLKRKRNQATSRASQLVRRVLSLRAFRTEHMRPSLPVVLGGVLSEWPALERWNGLAYLRRAMGHRTVPIEIGSRYTSAEWRQQLMTVDAFIDGHVLQRRGADAAGETVGGTPTAYLAQHRLFDQIPALAADIALPDFCTMTLDPDMTSAPTVEVNAWFGPAGTVSPAHFDPKHNLLCQVVGAKLVKLWSPAHSAALYPRDDVMSNTSRVDVDLDETCASYAAPDAAEFPLFAEAPCFECVLSPGETLYIPPGWWHFCKAKSLSFSVSFWW